MSKLRTQYYKRGIIDSCNNWLIFNYFVESINGYTEESKITLTANNQNEIESEIHYRFIYKKETT